MNISLTPELNALVKEKVATGMYNNASEAIREALRLLYEHDQLKAFNMERLKKELAIGLDALDRKEHGTRSVDDIAQKVLDSYQNK